LTNVIRITKAIPADQPEWDSFVLANPNASPYHLFAWGAAISTSYGHDIYYLMARQKGNLTGILPLVHLKLFSLLNELVALPFCDVGSCLTDDSAVEEALLVEAQKLGEQLKTKNIQLRGQLHGKSKSNFSIERIESNKVRMLLDLPSSSETLLANFKSKLRSQVRKAEKNGVSFRWTGQNGVDPFYSVFCNNMRDLGSPVHSKKLFQAIMEHFGENARIGLAEFEGKCIGAGLILSTNTQTAIPWASTLRQYNKLAPNMLLYWNCVKYAADHNKKIFDFGRSTENEGTFRFKKQWGAIPTPLLWYSSSSSVSQSTKEYQTNLTRREKLAQIWQTMPVPIASLIGPQFRKYISL
jgi:FemAB-related protein (PEP-CTERM system-associated)